MATWFDHTFKLEAPVEVTEQPDGRIEMSWAAENGSRVTLIVPREEFVGLVDRGERLLVRPVAAA